MITQPSDDVLRGPDRPPQTPDQPQAQVSSATLMTAATMEELRDELARLRQRSSVEIARQLREARGYGDGSNNDEYHAVREEQMVLEARVAALEQTIARATVVELDDSGQGAAVIGALVSVEDLASGVTTQYRLTSAHHAVKAKFISAASPIGQALIGSKPGAIVTVDLPRGKSRRLRLVKVDLGEASR